MKYKKANGKFSKFSKIIVKGKGMQYAILFVTKKFKT